MKKSIACILLALVAAFIVTGCEKKPDTTTVPDVSTNAPTAPK